MNAPWVAVVVEVPASEAEELAGWLGLGSLGVEVLAADAPARRRLRVYAEAGDASATVERIREVVRLRGLDPAPAVEPVEDQHWVERYQRGLRPFLLGERFLVVPGERYEADPPRTTIRLVPGRAFGTGEHPTTRMCVEALERELRPGQRWLDLGTGSGILGVVAARLGAAEVVAVDIDPEAVSVAREVVRANRVDDRVVVGVGGIERLRGTVDGVVANVSTSYFVSKHAALGGALGDGGCLIASGMRLEDREAVERALAPAGLQPDDRADLEGWARVVFRKEASG